MFLALKSESFGQYNRKSRHIWKESDQKPLWSDCCHTKYQKKFLLFSGVAFNVPRQCFFSEALTSPYKKTRYKKILQQFQIHCFYAHHLKKSRIFEILFLTGDINISVLRCVVSELHFQQLWWNIRYIFIEKKLLKLNVAKY